MKHLLSMPPRVAQLRLPANRHLSSTTATAPPARPALSVLIHGFSGVRLQLVPVASQLVADGHNVLNFAYASRTGPLLDHASSLLDAIALRKESVPPDTPVNFVCHSFGGIVLSSALREMSEDQIGRVVLIASPVRGCEFARIMAAGGGKAVPENLRPAVGQLAGLFLGQGVGLDLGRMGEMWWMDVCRDWNKIAGRTLVVAGNVGRRNAFLRSDSDLIVQVAETVLDVSHWRVEHRLTHNALLFSPTVLGQVKQFLSGEDVGMFSPGKKKSF